MSFSSATAARDASFTNMTTTNGNLWNQLRQQEDQIWSLQEELWNLKVESATRHTKVKGSNKTVQQYKRKKKQKPQWPTDLTEKYITTEITVGIMDTIKATRTRQTYARGKMLDTIMSLHEATQWGYHRTTRHTYGRKDDRDSGYTIKNSTLNCNGTD